MLGRLWPFKDDIEAGGVFYQRFDRVQNEFCDRLFQG